MQTSYITNTNYVQNPSFEIDTTYWSARSGVLTRQTSTVYTGTASAKLVTSAKLDLNVNVADTAYTNYNLSVVNNSSYRQINVSDKVTTQDTYTIGGKKYPIPTVPVISDSTTTSESVSVYAQPVLSGYENYGSIITPLPYQYSGQTYVAQAAVMAPAGTQLFIQFAGVKQTGVRTFTASGGWDIVTTSPIIADTGSFYLQIGTTAYNTTMYIDAIQVENNTYPTNYFDGSYGLGYHWYGVPNYSGSYVRAYEVESNSRSQQTDFGIQISWTKKTNTTYGPFTIGTSTIAGPDFIPGSAGAVGLFGQYQYIDYSVFGVSWSVTKSIGQYPYGVMLATATVELDNNLNTFSPGNDVTIGNYILPNRPIILSCGYKDIGQTLNMFEGLTTAPTTDINERLTTLNAYDYVTYLSSFTSVSTPDQVNQKADQIIQALLIEAGFSTSQFVLEPSLQPTIGYFSCYGQIATDLIQQLCEAEQGIFFCDEQGIMHFWNRQHIPLNNTIQWSFNFDTMVEATQENTPVINDVIVTAAPRVVQPKQSIYTLTTPIQIPAATQVASGGATTTNLILNPSFESDINYWSAPQPGGGYNPPNVSQASIGYGSGLTPSVHSMQSTGTSQVGSGGGYSSPAMNYYFQGSGYGNYGPFTPGQTYTIQGRVKANAGETIYCGWGWDSNYNNLTEFSGNSTMIATGGWDLISYTWIAQDVVANDIYTTGGHGSGTSYGGYYYLNFSTSNSSGGTAYLDQVMLTQGSGVPSYFDGSTPFTATANYTWVGAVNDSQSILTPVTTTLGTYNFTSTFDDPASSVDTPIYSAPLSTTTSSYTTNANSGGTGASQSQYVSIYNPQTLGGNYSVVFQNSFTQPVYITALELFGTPATVASNITQEYSNGSSILLYGDNPANNYQPLGISNDAIQDPSTAAALAYNLVNDYSSANARITIDVVAVPQLQFGDWVTVTFEDVGITKTYVVVGNTIGDSADDGLTQTLELEVHTAATYFTIGTSAIGGTSQISP